MTESGTVRVLRLHHLTGRGRYVVVEDRDGRTLVALASEVQCSGTRMAARLECGRVARWRVCADPDDVGDDSAQCTMLPYEGDAP